MSIWSAESTNAGPDEDGRHQSGGYDFGGYIPGEDYLPKRSRWRPLAALISVITIGSLLFWSFVVLF